MTTNIIGMKVDPTSYTHAADLIVRWARDCSSKYVCIAKVNNVMESYDPADFRGVMDQADLVTPDGMPLVWGLRLLGHTAATLSLLQVYTRKRFPALQVAYAYSPPFRPLTPEEDEQVVEDINRSGARILFIGLNTPKQDFWMAAHKGRVRALMAGVGATFDVLAGPKSQAPRWMMRIGMECFFRLVTEPRRLWKRYLKHNPRFVVLFAAQLIRERLVKSNH